MRNLQEGDGGKYTCFSYTHEGQVYSSELELTVEDSPPAHHKIKPSKVEHAEVGATVVLKCNSQRSPASYSWSRQHGYFGADVITNSVSECEISEKINL